ncbi:MAG: hypothetical protein M5U22_03980 [Thermoleophilia bacterium]|nr:hypothetical protein [Thermoleophilia bacterium]
MTGRSGAERRASRLLHLEPWSGAAGDMILAALVAAGGRARSRPCAGRFAAWVWRA